VSWQIVPHGVREVFVGRVGHVDFPRQFREHPSARSIRLL
jgi:hypothetical protein